MEKIIQILYVPLMWTLLLLFITFYPMLISIYVFFPLLIGVIGYILMRGIAENKLHYILIAIVYFMNLEVNLSLPFFLTIIATLLVYVLFYQSLTYFRKCQVCKPLLSVLLIDGMYLGLLLSYDFLFQTSSVMLDNILLYSLMVDLLLVVIL